MKTCKLWDVDHVHPADAAPKVQLPPDVEIAEAAAPEDVIK